LFFPILFLSGFVESYEVFLFVSEFILESFLDLGVDALEEVLLFS
jgi:hypothetical protein